MVKRFVECIQFNICSTVLATSLFEILPQWVIITLLFIIAFVIVIALLGLYRLIRYYIQRKFDSIDKHTDKKYQNGSNNDQIQNTYKYDKKEYQKDVSELEAKVMPDGQTVSNTVGKIIEFVKNK